MRLIKWVLVVMGILDRYVQIAKWVISKLMQVISVKSVQTQKSNMVN